MSTKRNIEKYKGSGTYWLRHIKKHNSSVIHLWNSDWYHDTRIVRFATLFSRLNSIVSSRDWANLMEENGLGGVIAGSTRPEHSKTMQGKNNPMYGKNHTKDSIDRMRLNSLGEKNGMFGKDQSGTNNPMFGRKQKRVICEHCNTDSPANIHARYHGNNCKLKI
jgi:hypothetical protein